jgi:hypothetical protein
MCGNKNFHFSYRIRGEESTITKIYHLTAIMLRSILVLSHNATCCGEKLLLLEVIVLGTKKSLSLLIVIALVTSYLLSLLKVIPLTARQKQ